MHARQGPPRALDLDWSARDEEDRWVFEFWHACGHVEVHRVRIPDRGQLRYPTRIEQEAVLLDMVERPCNACQLGVPAGRVINVIRVAETEG